MSIIFIGGYLRTGTTMLQSILCSSPDCNPLIGEAIFLRSIIETYVRSLEMFEEHSKYYFSDKEDLRGYCEGYVRNFIGRTKTRYCNPKYIVLKHPQLTPHFPSLHQLVKEAQFIVIVRDPRDIVTSAVTARKRGAKEFGNLSPQQIAYNLLVYYAACLSCQSDEFRKNTIYVKYEDLVQSPETIVHRMQSFTGVDLSCFHPDMENIRTKIDYDDQLEKKRPLHSEHYGKGISSVRIGRFINELEKDVIQDIEKICHSLLDLFNYSLTSNPK